MVHSELLLFSHQRGKLQTTLLVTDDSFSPSPFLYVMAPCFTASLAMAQGRQSSGLRLSCHLRSLLHLQNSHGTPISSYLREARGDIRGVVSEVHRLTDLSLLPIATVHTYVIYACMAIWSSLPASYLSMLALCGGDKYLS